MSRCRSCEATIMWAKTTKGKAIAVDADDDAGWEQPVVDEAGTLRPTGRSTQGRYGPVSIVEAVASGVFELGDTKPRWRPHFSTCPDANDWRN